MKHKPIPDDYEVRPLHDDEAAKDRATCGHCGLSWDDGIVTSMTPAPSARCPFEAFHTHTVTIYACCVQDESSGAVEWDRNERRIRDQYNVWCADPALVHSEACLYTFEVESPYDHEEVTNDADDMMMCIPPDGDADAIMKSWAEEGHETGKVLDVRRATPALEDAPKGAFTFGFDNVETRDVINALAGWEDNLRQRKRESSADRVKTLRERIMREVREQEKA